MDARQVNLQTLELKDLRFGHELAKGGINDRVSGRDSMIEQLAANIEAVGLLQPLVAWGNGSAKGAPPYYVLAGNRRLAALRLIQKTRPGAHVANVILLDAMDVNEALNLAASSNFHVPVHPVDRYETFARLVAGGMVEKAIAQTYSLEPKEVQRSLALGKLAPEIRNAWRDGKLNPELAKVFTLEPDLKRQASIYEKLKKSHALYNHTIRSAILGDNSKAAGMLKIVGRAAYEKAGGTFRVDLFAADGGREDPLPIDLPLLKKLSDVKVEAAVEQMKKAGWKWVMLESEAPPNARWNWQTHDGERGVKTPAAVKAQTGCLVGVGHEGIEVEYGLIMPKDAKAVSKAAEPEAAAKVKKAKADPKALSNALAARLDTQVALAVQDMLQMWATSTRLDGAACAMLAEMITPERLSWSSVKIEDVRRLRDADEAKTATAALLKRFDAKDYFASIPTALIKKLLETELFTKEGIAKMGKTQLVDIAVKKAAEARWLPLQMRQSAPKPAKKARRK